MSFLNRVGIGSNKLTTNSINTSNGKPNSQGNTSPQQSVNHKSPTSPVVATNSVDPNHVNLPSNLSNLSLSNQPRAITPSAPSGKALYLCSPFVKAALVKGSFRTIVSLPRYCDVNEVCFSSLLFFFYIPGS